MLDPDYLAQRAKLIDMKRAQKPGPGIPRDGGTVYLTAADASGMMVSLIQSNYMGFGSGVVVDGVSLQNRGATFVVKPAGLLERDYLKSRAKLIDPKRAQEFGAGSPPKGGTVYLTAADASGMMVSFIQSNYMGFGSGVVVDGVSLQNRGATFVLQPGHPNCVGPRKRPYQTIIPGFVTREGKPVMSFGVMGGTMQPQGHTQVMVRIADYGQSPQAACDGPRFRFVQGMDVSVEDDGFPAATLEELQRRGHRIVTIDDYNQFGSAQLIWRLDGGYFVASDPRRDGQAVGF